MRLELATIAGMDNSAEVAELLALSEKYDFFEVGISLHAGAPRSRFPSPQWVKEISRYGKKLRASAHIEDALSYEFLAQGKQLSLNVDFFRRMQLNIGPHVEELVALPPAKLKMPDVECILQLPIFSEAEARFVSNVRHQHRNISLLFDNSFGRGVLPVSWPLPPEKYRCGFAGGLRPENLRIELEKLAKLVGDRSIWIDIETGARNPKNDTVDLQRVELCLQIAGEYV